MNNQDYRCTIQTKATPAGAFSKIKLVQHWWATHFEGRCQQLNDVFTVRFGKTFGTFKIIELVENERMVWSVIGNYLHLFNNKTDWMGTRLVWLVKPIEGGATVTMIHEGLVPGKECFNDCQGGWNFYIQQSLFSLLQGTYGLPGSGIRTRVANAGRVYNGILYPKDEPLPGFAEECILIDVKEIAGEDVISCWSASILHPKNFDAQNLKGEHYMLVENKPVFKDVQPLDDIIATIK